MSTVVEIDATLTAVTPPIRLDESGVARVGNTRVTLDSFIYAFNEGVTAEELVQKFPTVSLSDAYGTIAYYLRNLATVDAYLARRAEAAKRNYERAQADPKNAELRARLVSLRAQAHQK